MNLCVCILIKGDRHLLIFLWVTLERTSFRIFFIDLNLLIFSTGSDTKEIMIITCRWKMCQKRFSQYKHFETDEYFVKKIDLVCLKKSCNKLCDAVTIGLVTYDTANKSALLCNSNDNRLFPLSSSLSPSLSPSPSLSHFQSFFLLYISSFSTYIFCPPTHNKKCKRKLWQTDISFLFYAKWEFETFEILMCK